MSETPFWYLLAGVILILMAFVSSRLKKLPVSSSLVYLGVGIALGPWVAGRLEIDFSSHSTILEHVSEIAVLISVFAAGLKLQIPNSFRKWIPAFVLAFGAMIVGIAGVAAFGIWGLGLSLGGAILLGAILAPTDPVLASSVQVKDTKDQDSLRYTLTAEAGLNDGTAFPFVYLGLGLLGLRELGAWGSKWILVDVLWALSGAVAVGAILGAATAKVVSRIRKSHHENVVFEDLLSIGLLCATYGLSLYVHAYGFVGCFVAGLAFRRAEKFLESSKDEKTSKTILKFNEQLERIVEFLVVIAIGVMLASIQFSWWSIGLAAFLLFVVRPLSILLLAKTNQLRLRQVVLISWFGVRGVGSIYYLAFALNNGITEGTESLIGSVVTVIAVSIVLHGLSSGPLMKWYERQQ